MAVNPVPRCPADPGSELTPAVLSTRSTLAAADSLSTLVNISTLGVVRETDGNSGSWTYIGGGV